MSAAAVLGNLRVILGGDNSGLDKSLNESQSRLTSFANTAKIGLAAVATAAAGAAAALVYQIKTAIDTADQMNKMSQSTGLSVGELSKLRYAADLADVSSESLGKSMGKLSKAMVSAANDGASPAAAAFTAMGVSVKNQDGTLRNSSDVLKDIAEKFSGYQDGAAKTALAIEIFGKAGAGMIPLLNAGKDGLEEAAEEAEKFGVVLDKKTTMAAENFNDNLRRMQVIKEGLVMTIASKMLPTLEQFSQTMLEAKQNSTLMNTAADALVGTFKALVTVGLSVVTAIKAVGAEFAALYQVAKAAASADWDGVKKGLDAFKQADLDTDAAGKALTETIASLWKEAPANAPNWSEQAGEVRSLNKEVNLLGSEWGKVQAPVLRAGEAQQNAIEKFLGSQAKRIAGMNAEAATVGLSVGEHEKLRVKLEAEAIAKEKNILLTDTLNARIAATGDAAALAAMKIAGANATQQAMSPVQLFDQQMTQLKALYDAGVISLETYAERQKQIAEQAGATWAQAGESMAGSFATIAGAFGKESSAMATAAKVFGVIQGTISMYTGAAKALELPFPANIAAMAAVLAKGASLVASIKGQSVPTGMMTGGSMMVRGSGGPDSVPVNMMLSPGEQVDVWRPDQGGGGDPRRGAGGAGTVNVSVPIVTTRDALRELMDGLNDMMADGYRLKIQA